MNDLISGNTDTELEKIKMTIFHSIMQTLSTFSGEISDLDIKELILKSIDLVPDYRTEWGEISKFGKNKLLINSGSRVMLLDVSEIVTDIKTAWNTYISSV
ncbi:MAG: hypothetical protein K8R21_06990 [Leptospira sp.]|nr:hypothetical protein [Leptospira sp.]